MPKSGRAARASASLTAARIAIVAACLNWGALLPDGAIAAAPPQGRTTEDAPETPGVLDTIVVTANRQRGAPATEVKPEVSLNSAVIQSLGAADLSEVFRELAPEIGSTPTSANAPGNTPIVLVNGQRIAGFSSIKDFPPEAVSRIDIFPEKVALQYGYGPDQRVVNVVLRDTYRALTLLGRYTLAPDTWRGIYRAKVDLIRIGEDAHWNVALDYSHTDAIYAGTTIAGGNVIVAGDGSTIPQHTLGAQDDHLTISSAINYPIGDVSAELTGSLDLDTLQSRPGLSDIDGALLAQEGLSNLVSGPFSRTDSNVQARLNLTLNGKLDSWRWSFIGRLDDSMRKTRTGSGFTDEVNAILVPSPALLGDACARADTGCVSTNVRRASSDLYLNGDVFKMPAGAVTAALRTGFAFAGLHGVGAAQSTSLTRDEGSAQGNIDFPITSRDAAIGKLSLGFNGELRQVSDFHTLSTRGVTLDWTPVRPVNLLLSVSRAEQAPTLLQLGEATLLTPDLRKYDFLAGTTTIATRSEQGNADLDTETARVLKARLQVTPLPAADLVVSAEYTLQHTRDPILNLTAATAAAMAAFPTRFTRQNGYLTAIDVSPVNGAHRDSQQLRWGLTYSTAFGPRWAAKTGGAADRRDQLQIALYDTWHLQDDVVLRKGLPGLDLLDGDLISDDGGTPAHRIELQTSVSTRPVSGDISAVWQTATTARAGALSNGPLRFSQGITLNLRVQINLADQHWLTRWIPFLRGNLNLSADNLLGAHTTVRDAGGIVPLAYSKSYLNPTGRTFRITLRKRFR